jgi:hypothetical protein
MATSLGEDGSLRAPQRFPGERIRGVTQLVDHMRWMEGDVGPNGFDIGRDGTALAALITEGSQKLYSINLDTGAATLIGPITDELELVGCLAISVTAGTLQLGSDELASGEADGEVVITVTRTGGSEGAVTVDYATSDGTATAGTHYEAAVGTLTFADGETEQSFAVTLNDDLSPDGDKTFEVALSAPTAWATLGPRLRPSSRSSWSSPTTSKSVAAPRVCSRASR